MAATTPLNAALATLKRVLADLTAEKRRFALIGGLAVGARAEPRTTRDVDLAVAVADDRDAESLVRALLSRGYQIVTTLEQDAAGRLATVRLRPPLEPENRVIADLLFASSGIEPEIVAAADEVDMAADLRAPIASIGDLIALKVLARHDERRPQDWDDLKALFREAAPADLERARESLRLIAARGYHRGRNLIADLERAQKDTATSRLG